MNHRKIIAEVFILCYVVLFVYAAVSKLRDTDLFASQVGQSPILAPITTVVVWTIPITEIVIAIFLVFDRLRLAGLIMAFGLMTLFTTYIIGILQFSDHIPCSCGGVLQTLSWTEHVVFNLVFIAMALFAIYTTVDQLRHIKQAR